MTRAQLGCARLPVKVRKAAEFGFALIWLRPAVAFNNNQVPLGNRREAQRFGGFVFR